MANKPPKTFTTPNNQFLKGIFLENMKQIE